MWQLGKACVIIHIKGKRAERLLNALRGNGIPLRHVTRLSPDELRLTMPAKSFRQVRRHAGRLHCRVHIESRSGMPFLLMKLYRRRALWIGCLIGLLLLIAASTRIWFIRVEGNERVAETTVRRALALNGLSVGCAKPAQTFEALADAIASYDDRIAWIGLDLDGVRLVVSVSEAEYDMLAVEPEQACDVVAVKDGVVTQVQALDGTAMFAPGDPVRAGDVLISGIVELPDIAEPMLVHARGSVRASISYFSEYAQQLMSEQRVATGAAMPYRRVSICGLTLYESKAPYADYEITGCRERLLHFPLLPITLCEGIWEEMADLPVESTPAEAAETALVEAEKGALLRIPLDAAITYKASSWLEKDGVVIATCVIQTEESIGMTKEIGD